MHFLSELRLFLPGTTVLRPASVWERLKEAVGVVVDRSTPERSLQHDALSLVEQLEHLMTDAGVHDATWLAVDEQVIFHDRKRDPDDLSVLDRAVHEQAPRLLHPFEMLTLVFEYAGKDLEVLLEARVRSSFRQGAPAITLALGGRVPSLRRTRAEPQPEARTRLAQLLAEQGFLVDHAAQFVALADRLQRGLMATFEGRVEREEPRVVVVRPSPHYLGALAEVSLRASTLWAREAPLVGPAAPPVIDPWDRYYQDLGYAWVDLTEIDQQMFPPGDAPAIARPLRIVDTRGNALNEGADLQAQRDQLYSAHLAALHDYTEPDRRHRELQGYAKAQGA